MSGGEGMDRLELAIDDILGQLLIQGKARQSARMRPARRVPSLAAREYLQGR
jgi:hypothetical protein